MLSIGQVSKRTGLAVSAIRYYEDMGLITVGRNAGGQRRYHNSDIRILSLVMVAQRLGFTIQEIKSQIDMLPAGKGLSQQDWTKMAGDFRIVLDQRIAKMESLRDRLEGCIGCGCLSMENCALYNPEDKVAKLGTGPQLLSSNGAGL